MGRTGVRVKSNREQSPHGYASVKRRKQLESKWGRGVSRHEGRHQKAGVTLSVPMPARISILEFALTLLHRTPKKAYIGIVWHSFSLRLGLLRGALNGAGRCRVEAWMVLGCAIRRGGGGSGSDAYPNGVADVVAQHRHICVVGGEAWVCSACVGRALWWRRAGRGEPRNHENFHHQVAQWTLDARCKRGNTPPASPWAKTPVGWAGKRWGQPLEPNRWGETAGSKSLHANRWG
eukprot:366382-Chlamydomonas_euryale.AAC.8